MREKYTLEALLHIKEIFEKEQAPDYHALVWLSFASLHVALSPLFGKIQINLTKQFFPKESELIKEKPLEEYEKKELTQLKQRLFKAQMTHIKNSLKKEKEMIAI